MRLKLLPVLCFFLSLNFLQAQEVPETQIPLITKVTATWCGPCGTWGWDLFEGILEDNEGNAIVLAAHYSGDLFTPAGDDLAANFNATSQPRFIFNNQDILANSGNANAKRADVKSMVESANMQSPLMNTGMIVTRADNNYTIKAKTKFFADVNGKIRLTIMAVESEVMANQATRGIVPHANVVRGVVGPNAFGEVIIDGAATAGQEFDATYTLPIEGSWNPDHMEIVAILWSEVDNDFIYMNGNIEVETVVSGLNQTLTNSFEADWRKEGSQGALFLNAPKSMGQTNISVFSSNGQKISETFDGVLANGQHQFPIDLEGLAGTYLIRIISEEGSTTVKAQ